MYHHLIVAVLAICISAMAVRMAKSGEAVDESAPASVENPDDVQVLAKPKPSITEARQRAEILHDLLHHLLHDVHRNYYREDEGLLLPAATFHEVFDGFSKRNDIRIRWISVEVEPMNLDHRPANDFERDAVKALLKGQPAFDQTTDSEYKYAGPIRLTAECLKCHVPNRTSTRDRLAGIVITMPVLK